MVRSVTFLVTAIVCSHAIVASTAAQSSIDAADPSPASIEALVARANADWLDLTIAELGAAWWTVHQAHTSADAAFGNYTIAVVVGGKVGYIDTKRLAPMPRGGLPTFVLSDLYETYADGSYAVLVSGNPPPIRPDRNPLAWRGFIWEGLVAPDTLLRDLFTEVAVVARADIAFAAGTLRPALDSVQLANVSTPTASQIADNDPGQVPAQRLVGSSPKSTARGPESAGREPGGPEVKALRNDTPLPIPTAGNTPPVSVQSPAQRPTQLATANTSPASRQSAVAPRTDTPKRKKVTLPRIASTRGATSRPRHPKNVRLERIAQINLTLRRRVAYMEALLIGPDLGREITLDTPVFDLIDVIMRGKKKPQRNVFMRISSERGSRVGRVVTASRYPLYKFGAPGRGSHQVLMDLEVRGPDGNALLRSGAGEAIGRVVPGAPVQYRGISRSTTLGELGVLEAVWWPVNGLLGTP